MLQTPEEANNQQNQSGSEQANSNSSQSNENIPGITLPKGGGSISSIGEKFQANPVTGTGNTSIPLPISSGRNGFTPALSLQYDSGNGNGPFGIGWNVGIPSIVRKTQKGLPQYQDNNESDIFILAGSEDLVPALEKHSDEESGWVPISRTHGDTFVQVYRPRTEGLFAKIEKHTDTVSNNIHWQVTTRDNITTVYGQSENARIFDAENASRIFEWLIEYTFDEKGNITLYEYKSENSDSIPLNVLSEKNRLSNNNSFNKKYLKYVKYNPDTPFNPTNESFFSTVKWNFQLVFDYGEHDESAPTTNEINNWAMRLDAFSSFRAGFEIRTYRLCQRVLMFHYFPDDLEADPVLVKSTDITYDENRVLTQITEITQRCYQTGQPSASYPPINFQYTEANIDPNIHRYTVEDANNLPIGVDGAQYRWVDLLGEGIQGVLSEDNNAWYFKENFGDENYYRDAPVNATPSPEARLSPIRKVAKSPSLANLTNRTQQLTDLDGDGTVDLVINNATTKGFYTQNKDHEWNNFIPFEAFPNIDFNDPSVRVMDVNGDGFPDIIMTEENCFTIYHSQGKDGYSPSYKTLKSFDDEQGPAIIFADSDQSVYLADMSGDGLTDIVSIRNGSVYYWPNMGYGAFGNKVSMDNAPLLDYQDTFNQQRVRLTDIDGSGTTDILYIAENDVRYYPNQSGNSFADAVVINERLPTHNLASITPLDILGNGTQCLVWSSPVPGDHPPAIKFIDLMGGVKPYLMTEMNNNMGSITRLKYAPSTKFYLRDKRAGNPWITKLPFPVQVVEHVELYDEISRNRFVTKYTYRHGYFDGVEREFRGFGMVEQTDTETFSDFTEGGLFPPGVNASEEILYVPPVLTKTWFHTGFYEEGTKILGQYNKEYWSGDGEAVSLEQQLQTSLSSDNIVDHREAARALRGSPLRQEVYSLDGSAVETNPYTVTENNYDLAQIQPRDILDRRDRDYGVYLITPGETLSYQYERNPEDPRIGHQLTLETDTYGTVLQAAAVAYPRRLDQGYAEQNTTKVTYAQNSVLHANNNPTFYRIGMPLESKSYEVVGFTDRMLQTRAGLLSDIATATEVSFETVPDGSLQKRLLDRNRVLYYDENLNESTSLPFGQVPSHGLPFETYQLAFTAGLIAGVLNDNTARVDHNTFAEGAYTDLLSDGNYWIPSGKAIFDAASFYLPIAQEDPFGNRGLIAYDAYSFLPLQTTDAVGNITTATYDYRILQPDLVTDPNGNQQAFTFDVRGMVHAVAIMGKTGDNDGDTIGDPTSTFEYDLFRWLNEQKPNVAYSKTRETHADVNTRYLESYAYSGGLGQAIMTKVQAAPGDAFSRDANGELLRNGEGKPILVDTNPRWIGSGRTILDNKGNPVKQYEPYFSTTSEYENETELVEYGVTPIVRYDPLGRAIKTDLPDDTITRVTFTPWEQKNYDQNDTVLESLWYVEKNTPDPASTAPTVPNERAAWLAAQHADTPQVIHIDNLGRPFVTIDNNGVDGLYSMVTQLDIKGNPLGIIDAKGRASFTYIYNMLNRPIKTTHLDNGVRYAMSDAVGNPFFSWDERNQQFRFSYDVLLRPTKTYLTTNYNTTPAAEHLISLTVYGESVPNPDTHNLRGLPYLIFDAAGLVKNTAFDFKGNPSHTERQLATTYQTSPNWISLNNETTVSDLLLVASSLLESEVFSMSTTYDALNRPLAMIKPDDSEVIPSYDESGSLSSLKAKLRGSTTTTNFVSNIKYNERGQRKYITYANGSHTTYHYDNKTFRLNRLLTTRNTGADILQDLNYTYDPVGNIVEQIDNAQQTHFFNNTEVTPNGKYEYDPLYRLLKAQGRELIGLNVAGSADININTLPENTTALRQYSESYVYDELGNIEKMIHAATGGNWTRHYHYNNGFTNNLLLSNSTDGVKPADQYTYDTHGNMLTMPHLNSMTWDYADRLQGADLGGGGTAFYHYDGEGNRVRKVIVHGNITEQRIYLGDYEVYRKMVNGVLDTERETLHIKDDTGSIAVIDTETTNSNTINIRYQLSNHLGSACLELDDTAETISYEEYHPFGTTAYRAGRNQTETSLKRYRYVGKERDEETGLYYYGARYYAGWLARFISVDPLKDDYPHLTPYQYASNDPIGDIDIDGLQSAKEKPRRSRADTNKANIDANRNTDISAIPSIPKFEYNGNAVRDVVSAVDNAAINFANEGIGFVNSASATFNKIKNDGLSEYGSALKQELTKTYEGIKSGIQNEIDYLTHPDSEVLNDTIEGFKNPEILEKAISFGVELFVGSKGVTKINKLKPELKTKNPLSSEKVSNVSPEGEGIIYRRTDINEEIEKPYVGQAKSESRYAKRQKEHARANPDSDFEFEIIDRGSADGDFPTELDLKEQKALDALKGPTNKSNSDGGASNKKNVIRQN